MSSKDSSTAISLLSSSPSSSPPPPPPLPPPPPRYAHRPDVHVAAAVTTPTPGLLAPPPITVTANHSPLKRTRSPSVPTSAPSKMQRSRDDSSTTMAPFQSRLGSTVWKRSRSHQVVNLKQEEGPPKRRTILALFPRELVFVILGHLSFDDIRSFLKADRRLRPFVHIRSFATWRKQLAQFQYHERKYDELVRRKGDAVYQSELAGPSETSPCGLEAGIDGASTPGPGGASGPQQGFEAAFTEAYVEALLALRLSRPPLKPWDLVTVVSKAFPSPAGLSRRLQQFVFDLLLGEAQARQAFGLVDSPMAVELLSLVRLFCNVLRISRGFTPGGEHAEASQTVHFINADCRDAVKTFFRASQWRSSGDAFQLTDEQRRFVDRDVRPGEVVKVQAFAGTGKTRSLVAYAIARPKQQFLYIAFNTHAAADARYRFPRNVDCRTMHSVCLRQVQPAKDQRLASIKPRDLVSLFEPHLPKGQRTVRPNLQLDSTQADPKLTDTAVASYVLRTLNQYMYSDDREFDVDKHVPKQMQRDTDLPPARVLKLAAELWEAVRKGKTADGQPVPCPHDAYVKMLQLTQPKQPDPFFRQYDVLLLDEAQDLSSAQVCILLRAKRTCGILVVGDAHQKIYGFRGGTAKAFNDQLYPPTATFQLTQSFRFGDSVAQVASKILGLKAAAPWQERPDRPSLTGVKGDADRVYTLRSAHPAEQSVMASVATQRLHQTSGDASPNGATGIDCGEQRVLKHTKIFRSNKGLLETALVYGVTLDDPHRIFLKTSQKLSQSSVVTLLRDGYILYNGPGGPLSFGSILREFSGWKELVQRVEAEDGGGDGMLALVASLEEFFRTDDFLDRLDSLKSRFSATEKDASIVLTTCHQSKGLEWDRVVVADDFRPAVTAGRGRMSVEPFRSQDELNLMYVAVTRAKKELIVSGATREWLVAMDGICQLKVETLEGETKCLACGQGGKLGVVRVFRMGEHDFVSRSSNTATAIDDEFDDFNDNIEDSAVATSSDEDELGPSPPYKKAVGCLTCLSTHRLELDEDVTQFLEMYRQSRTSISNTTTTTTTDVIAATSNSSSDRSQIPLLTHPQRQANWDRLHVETINTVQRWCLLERFPGLLPSTGNV